MAGRPFTRKMGGVLTLGKVHRGGGEGKGRSNGETGGNTWEQKNRNRDFAWPQTEPEGDSYGPQKKETESETTT